MARLALLAVGAVLVTVSAAGTAMARHPDQKSAAPSRRPHVAAVPGADATRTRWYETVEGTAGARVPVKLTEADITRGAEERAATVGATVVAVHYLPLFGGTAELVVQPDVPDSFFQTGSLSAILGPLGRPNGAYLLTIVDSTHAPLLVLGYTPTPEADREIGEGIAWEAPGVHSGAIFGEPVTLADLTK